MHRLPTTAILLVLGSSSVLAQTEPGAIASIESLTGTWKLRVSLGRRGERTSILKLDLDGDRLTGVLLGAEGTRTPIENAAYENGSLSFEVSRERDGERFTTRYTGTISGDTMRGTARAAGRGRPRELAWEALPTTSEEHAGTLEPPPIAADIELNEENYAVWRDLVLPEASELNWQQIPWLTTFKDGILAADAAQKPLLLWTMNGHPLGCT